MLRERNKSYGAIKFVDISSEDYSPNDNQGLDYETVRMTPIYTFCVCVCVCFLSLCFLMNEIYHLMFGFLNAMVQN